VLLSILIGLASALAAAWIALTAVLILARPKGLEWRSLTVFIPNVLRLLRRLYRDPEVPRTVRVRVWIAIAYNIQPFNLIPDFVPVIGFADNVVVTAWALRSAVRQAGMDAVSRHWPGPADQFALLIRVVRLRPPPPDTIMIQGRPHPGVPTV
jgi:uncharacterized membrane protein YkvA (DUF1232 family)